MSASLAFVLAGCAERPEPARPGALELSVEPQASYAMVGRFRLNAIEPWSPSRDIDFDSATSSARIELPAGSFTLALGAGARLVCAGEEAGWSAASVVPRLVSASPQIISVAAGQVTRARIRFGGTRAPGAEAAPAAAHWVDAPDPCGTRLEIAAAFH